MLDSKPAAARRDDLAQPSEDQTRRLPPARIRTRAPAPDAATPEPQPTTAMVEPASAPDSADPALPEPEAPVAEPDAYKVGFRKPPKHTQFPPGRSGNPRGRPKGSKATSTLVAEALAAPIVAKVGGRSVKMTRREAMVRQFIEQAMRGDLKAFALLLKLDPVVAQAAEAVEAATNEPLSAEDQALLMAFIRRRAGEEGGQ
jgi:hypothetical protein